VKTCVRKKPCDKSGRKSRIRFSSVSDHSKSDMSEGLRRSFPRVIRTFGEIILIYVGTAVAQWLTYCATIRKFAGSIPDSVIGIFH
jgi:hypothetical protein